MIDNENFDSIFSNAIEKVLARHNLKDNEILRSGGAYTPGISKKILGEQFEEENLLQKNYNNKCYIKNLSQSPSQSEPAISLGISLGIGRNSIAQSQKNGTGKPFASFDQQSYPKKNYNIQTKLNYDIMKQLEIPLSNNDKIKKKQKHNYYKPNNQSILKTLENKMSNYDQSWKKVDQISRYDELLSNQSNYEEQISATKRVNNEQLINKKGFTIKLKDKTFSKVIQDDYIPTPKVSQAKSITQCNKFENIDSFHQDPQTGGFNHDQLDGQVVQKVDLVQKIEIVQNQLTPQGRGSCKSDEQISHQGQATPVPSIQEDVVVAFEEEQNLITMQLQIEQQQDQVYKSQVFQNQENSFIDIKDQEMSIRQQIKFEGISSVDSYRNFEQPHISREIEEVQKNIEEIQKILNQDQQQPTFSKGMVSSDKNRSSDGYSKQSPCFMMKNSSSSVVNISGGMMRPNFLQKENDFYETVELNITHLNLVALQTNVQIDSNSKTLPKVTSHPILTSHQKMPVQIMQEYQSGNKILSFYSITELSQRSRSKDQIEQGPAVEQSKKGDDFKSQQQNRDDSIFEQQNDEYQFDFSYDEDDDSFFDIEEQINQLRSPNYVRNGSQAKNSQTTLSNQNNLSRSKTTYGDMPLTKSISQYMIRPQTSLEDRALTGKLIQNKEKRIRALGMLKRKLERMEDEKTEDEQMSHQDQSKDHRKSVKDFEKQQNSPKKCRSNFSPSQIISIGIPQAIPEEDENNNQIQSSKIGAINEGPLEKMLKQKVKSKKLMRENDRIKIRKKIQISDGLLKEFKKSITLRKLMKSDKL